MCSLGIVAGFIHLVTWDSYFATVIPLKTRQILRIASTSDLLLLAQICEDRKNPDCSETALEAAANKNPDDVNLKERLAKIRHQMGDHQGAAQIYTQYFNQGGRELEAAFLYAKSLRELDRKGEAAQYFEFILEKKPETLQISVTQQYVNLLKDMGQYQRAIQLIESIRKKGSNAAYFLDAELQDLKKRARSRSRSS